MAAIKTLKECAFCKKSVYRIAARGLCPACYYREKRNGTPCYTKVRKPCSVEACERLSVAQGLCDAHYRRLARHGVVEAERFDKWGHIESHPLKDTFRWATRHRAGVIPEWNDFWAFVAGVGERPTLKHKLRRVDAGQPLGPENFEWQAPALNATMEQLAGQAGYMRAYRAANPKRFKDYDLRKHFGIGFPEYAKMLADQGGQCGICRSEEAAINPSTGLPRDLAVDHCHDSGTIRGLLCTNCNTGIGAFGDDPDKLRAAIDYVERHKPKPSSEG